MLHVVLCHFTTKGIEEYDRENGCIQIVQNFDSQKSYDSCYTNANQVDFQHQSFFPKTLQIGVDQQTDLAFKEADREKDRHVNQAICIFR